MKDNISMNKIYGSIALLLILICVLSCGCASKSTLSPGSPISATTNPSNNAYLTPTGINNSNLSSDEKRIVDIVLSNDEIKRELSGHNYLISNVKITNYSRTFPPIEDGQVQIDILNQDGSIDYHILASVDFQNNSVSFINREKPLPFLPAAVQQESENSGKLCWPM